MNAAILPLMKPERKQTQNSFIIRDKRPTRRPADLLRMAETPEAVAGARQPTREEIADLAIELAREDGHDLGSPMEELFHWPAAVAPCTDQRKLFLPRVEKYKKLAAEELRRPYLYYHALEIRNRHRLRARPRPHPRASTITKQTLRTVPPPPRR